MVSKEQVSMNSQFSEALLVMYDAVAIGFDTNVTNTHTALQTQNFVD